YSKRKRTSLLRNLSENASQVLKNADDRRDTQDAVNKPDRNNMSAVKGVILGYWRDSSGPDESTKHAVTGFIDVRGILRFHLQPSNTVGETIPSEYPLPPGPGGRWIRFDRVVFFEHLVGLVHNEIKEYVRMQSDQQCKGGEKAAVEEAIRRAKLNPANNKNLKPPLVAYGLEIPNWVSTSNSPDAKRRKFNGGFSSINQTPQDPPAPLPPPSLRTHVDPPLGTTIAHKQSAKSINQSPRPGFRGHERRRRSRRVGARTAESRSLRQSPKVKLPPPVNPIQTADTFGKINSPSHCEIAQIEAAQVRANRHALYRECAAASAAAAAAAAAAAITPVTKGRAQFHTPEEMQRLNRIWPRQDSIRLEAGAEDAKNYGGIRYERKSNGPFIGKFVSQGTILNIDDEDYIEYRILTKPSFY
ncbi:hypothetical protein B0T10DRAFT_372037, partial [Thelonectria olida]